jgi:hypothetical protein
LENAKQKEKRLGRPLIHDSILEQAKAMSIVQENRKAIRSQ